MKLKKIIAPIAVVLGLGSSGVSMAGPFILDQTDADDHGFFNGTDNQDGWFYMQRVLDNLVGGVTNTNTVVAQLGADSGSEAYNAAQSAFDQSLLPGMGWSWTNVTDVNGFFDGTGAVTIDDVGIIQIDSGFNVSGGSDSSEQSVIDSNGTSIDSFLGSGGALHSMANSYGWLTALLPGLIDDSSGGSGLFLTAEGSAAFPGLSDSDLSAGPFHGNWQGDLGGLTTLFVDGTDRVVGIGSEGGSITDPGGNGTVPAPGTLVLLGLGLAALLTSRRQQKH